MDKKEGNKTFNFLKKEGFYVVLFACLCIVATAAALTAKRSTTLKPEPPVALQQTPKSEPSNKVSDLPSEPKIQATQPEDATEVKNNTKTTETASSETQKAVAVNTKPTLNFYKPVVGKLILGYSDLAEVEPTDANTLQKLETVDGLYISAKIGQDVFASEAGTIIQNDSSLNNYGTVVTIKHSNGLTTVYGNLNEKLNVKVGDKVTRGQKIGVIGTTSTHAPKQSAFSEGFLYFEMLKDNIPVDPSTYNIKY